jgi:hypothetical protein
MLGATAPFFEEIKVRVNPQVARRQANEKTHHLKLS